MNIEYWRAVIDEILGDYPEIITDKIVERFASSATVESEYCGTHEFHSGKETNSCPKCEVLMEELAKAKKQIECYKNSVKERRGASDVWIGNNGEVRYGY